MVACIHLWFEPDRNQTPPASVEILATVEDKDYHRSNIRISDIPFTQIMQSDSAYIMKANSWVTTKPVKLMLEILGYGEDSTGQQQTIMTHWITIPPLSFEGEAR